MYNSIICIWQVLKQISLIHIYLKNKIFDMQNPEYMEERAGIDAVRSHEKMFHTLVMNEKMYMTD